MVDLLDLPEFDFDEASSWEILSTLLTDCDLATSRCQETPTTCVLPTPSTELAASVTNLKKNPRKRKAAKSKMIIKKDRALVVPAPKLYIFPSFDKSDAMIYLPSTIARLTNSGDIDRMIKLIKGHCARDCEVVVSKSNEISIPMELFMGMLEVATTLYPDMISCMHTTKVVDNQIHATMYYKYTDYPNMADHARVILRIKNDPLFLHIFTMPRKEAMVEKLRLNEQPDDISAQICSLLDREEEFQIYGKEEITITIDPHSKKITSYQSINTLQSVCHDGIQYKLLDVTIS